MTTTSPPTTPPSPPEPTAVVRRKAVDRIRAGHLWIYRSDVARVDRAEPGSVVRVIDGHGHFLGRAFWSSRSLIALRLLTHEDEPVDAEFVGRRIDSAMALRARLYPGETTYRLLHGDADGLSSIIVDRYGDHLVVQTLSEGSERMRGLLLEVLLDRFHPACIIERNDARVRTLEGLEQKKGVLFGRYAGPVEYAEGDVRLLADLLEGQKTGAFLDQRENRAEAARYADGEALDCFSYNGGFGVHLAKGGASHVKIIEISERQAATIRDSAERNGVADRTEVITANAFDFLRDEVDAGKRYRTIALDPPAFARSRAQLEGALRGYKEINLRALMLLERGGVLLTASCSHHVDELTFEQVITEAAADAGRRVQMIERRGAARDHPSLLGVPESRYLKFFVCRVLT